MKKLLIFLGLLLSVGIFAQTYPVKIFWNNVEIKGELTVRDSTIVELIQAHGGGSSSGDAGEVQLSDSIGGFTNIGELRTDFRFFYDDWGGGDGEIFIGDYNTWNNYLEWYLSSDNSYMNIFHSGTSNKKWDVFFGFDDWYIKAYQPTSYTGSIGYNSSSQSITLYVNNEILGQSCYFILTSRGISISQLQANLTDNAPTDAEIDAAIGTTPLSAGAGFQVTIKDTDGTGLLYKVESDGTSWYYTVMTKAL